MANLLPLIGVFAIVGVVLLYAHAPHVLATRYSAPKTLVHRVTGGNFTVVPRGYGYGVIDLTKGRTMAMNEYSPRGRFIDRYILDNRGFSDSDITAAGTDQTTLVCWLRQNQSGYQLLARIVHFEGGGRVVRLTQFTGVSDPTVLTYDGRFYVSYEQTSGNLNSFFLSEISSSTGQVVWRHRLLSGTSYVAFPQISFLPSGRLLMLYMEVTGGSANPDWSVEYKVLGPALQSLGHGYLGDIPELDPTPTSPITIPSQWGINLQPTSYGAVGAWETDGTVAAATWDQAGHFEGTVTALGGGVDSSAPSIQVVPHGTRSEVFVSANDGVQTEVLAIPISSGGRVGVPQRVEFASDGSVATPVALWIGGHQHVFWQFTGDTSELSSVASSVLGGIHPPTTMDRLGFSGENPWLALLFILAGSFIGATMIALINAGMLIPMVLSWLVISRIPASAVRWASYMAVVAVVLLLAFGLTSFVSKYALLITPEGLPYGLLVVAGGTFSGYWFGRWTLGKEDELMRAATTAVFAVYFVAFMWVAIKIQAGIGPV